MVLEKKEVLLNKGSRTWAEHGQNVKNGQAMQNQGTVPTTRLSAAWIAWPFFFSTAGDGAIGGNNMLQYDPCTGHA